MAPRSKSTGSQTERPVPDGSDRASGRSGVSLELTPKFSPGVVPTPETPRRQMTVGGQRYVLVNGGWRRAPREVA